MEYDAATFVDLDHTIVELIADQRFAIAQAHGGGGKRVLVAARQGVGLVLPDDLIVPVDLDDAVVVGIGNQRMTVLQATRECSAADGPLGSELMQYHAAASDFEDAIVVLVGNQDMAVFQHFRAVWIVELIGAGAGHPGSAVLPDNLTLLIDKKHAVDSASVRSPRRLGGARGPLLYWRHQMLVRSTPPHDVRHEGVSVGV